MDSNRKWLVLFQLFLSFLKIGPISFGGGYSVMPLIEREVVKRRGWMKEEEMGEVFVVAQTVPGAIAINSAAFIGYRLSGVLGAIAAALGMLVPTFVIVMALSIFYIQFEHIAAVQAAFKGIGASVVAMITFAAYRMSRTSFLDKTTIGIAALAVLCLLWLHVHPIFVIAGGCVLGMITVKIRDKAGRYTRLENEELQYKSHDYFIGDGI
ncbi:chromate transporter [Marinicrinis lubricantis]|uniref:Chromate transporter n=1 Tax=Marinicrinis lubricantis TaxID=2086470 RepID=A0ABW1ILJ1_9BACL